MTDPRLQDCVFCTGESQPELLFETQHFYAMPDKFPLLPGHILIITKEHRRCHAEAPIEELQELEAAVGQVRRFLEDSYGKPVYISESGIAHQTVFHAHLHLAPFSLAELPYEIAAYEGVSPVQGWRDVRDYFVEHGPYRYVELAAARYVIDPYGPSFQIARNLIAERAGLTLLGEHGVAKTTTDADVQDVARRWAAWTGASTPPLL